jgi:acetyl-CoA carboxylase biotin carboxyl carrier protein
MNLRTLRTIIELFEASSAVEMELDNSIIGKLKLRRAEGGAVAPRPVRLPEVPTTAVPSQAEAMTTELLGDSDLVSVNSPFVGTFYRSPTPESDPFVSVGDRVKKGQTVCIIEAMKLMNELEAECDGVIEAVLAENGTPVEHGQPVIKIRPA